MKKLLILIPFLLFGINKEFEEKYLSQVKQYEKEINNSKLLEQNINIQNIQIDMNNTLKKVNFKKQKNIKAENEADKINSYIKSNNYQENIRKMKKYILYDKKLDFSKYIPKDLHIKLKKNNYLGEKEKIYIVISSSMPITTIQNYFETAQRAGQDITFVLRGLIGNDIRKIKPTLNWINKVLTKDSNKKSSKDNRFKVTIQINPKVTEHFGISEVPAIIFVKKYDGFLDKYETLPKEERGEETYIAYGDANLIYALEKINKKAKSKTLSKLIKNMRGSFF